MTAHFFSDQDARGKRRVPERLPERLAVRPPVRARRRSNYLVIRALALVLTVALLLAAAWFGSLRGRTPLRAEPLTIPPAATPYIAPIAEPQAPPAPLRRTPRRARPAIEAATLPAAPADDLIVLSASELDAISQARDPEALPSAPQNATNRPEPAFALEGTTHGEDQSGQPRRRTRRR
jgi:hypothetical protein